MFKLSMHKIARKKFFCGVKRTCLSAPETISLTGKLKRSLLPPIFLSSLLLALQQSLSVDTVSIARYLGTDLFIHKLLIPCCNLT